MTPTFRAALWMIGAIGSFSTMAVAGREVSVAMDTFEIMTYRSLIGLLIVASVLTVTRSWARVSTRNMPAHLTRNVAHFIGQNLWFFAVTAVPLAQVFALEFTSPLWVIVLSPLMLGERITPPRALAALMGFAGILIVARPSPDTLSPGLIAAASSAVFFALTTILTKRLTRRESTGGILFWLTLIQLGLGLVCAGFDGDMALPDLDSAPWLVLIGLAGLMAHFCITNALALAPATVVVPFDFARLPAIAVIGMLLYGEALDFWVFTGALIILAGNYFNIMSETRNATP